MPFKQAEVEVFNESGRPVPVDERIARKCVSEVARQEACSFRYIEIVYVDEEGIRTINRKHLGRDYVTDIISFRYDGKEDNLEIEGSLACCAHRIAEQALEYEQEENTEFIRILVHGLLHLAGYDDRTEELKEKMSAREDFYVDLLT